MGLNSVTSTALTGLVSATAIIDVVANNLANSQTPGFQAAEVILQSQASQTLGYGHAPSGLSGGLNPFQGGMGVAVGGIETDFSPGSLQLDEPLPLLALDGEGLFILEDQSGQRFYSRDGRFRLNSADELTNAYGYRVMGYALDEQGRLDTTQLASLTVEIGSEVRDSHGRAANLQTYTVGSDGRIIGKYSDGVDRTLGQVRLARFQNPGGLYRRANTLYQASAISGQPLETNPGTAGAATIVAHAIERSNVDIGKQLLDLARARTQFRLNLLVAITAQDMLSQLIRWRR
ncbi:MAG TPA: flagellar hook basal-body protein [Pirellulaceae bacterium]|nr:flagellar hook basal-body protein [Pirellulaceae bacterium]